MDKKKYELYLFGHPIKEYIPILFFFSIIGAIGIIEYEIGTNNIWATGSAVYLLIAFFLYYNSTTQDNQHKEHKIAELNQKIRKLEETKECLKLDIQLLKKELETEKKNTQQN